jgi:hypothetical protein
LHLYLVYNVRFILILAAFCRRVVALPADCACIFDPGKAALATVVVMTIASFFRMTCAWLIGDIASVPGG